MSSSPPDDPALDEHLQTYRDRLHYTDSAKISHPVDCFPDSCSLVGYVEDGKLQYQEQTGKYPVVDPDTPDWNPRGCSRQCSFTDATYGDERIKQPMRQTGERGSDNWEPISWEEAFEEVADALIDAMEENPQSIVAEQPPLQGGAIHGVMPFGMFMTQVGGVFIDMDALVGDTFLGQNITFGKIHHGSTHDDWFKSELLLVWHANPAYSRNPGYHFLTESRYHGGEMVTIAPDFSPSCVHADEYVPVEPASDAALALGMCREVLNEGWEDREFVETQTDLPLLVRDDTDRFLREEDLEVDGSEEQFYVWDERNGLVQPPRDTLDIGEVEPKLEGEFQVRLENGEEVTVRPVLERIRDRLEEYDPETVEAISGVAPETVRDLAEKVAHNRTAIVNSFNVCKIFHGDLIERSMALLLGLTGNWGRRGTGMRGWGAYGEPTAATEDLPFVEEMVREGADRPLTDEEIARSARNRVLRMVQGTMVPAVFWWHRHCGYDEVWDEVSLESAGIPRSVSSYFEEAEEEGWWDGLDMPSADVDPNVLLLVGSNTLRRTRGGTRVLLEELWPKLDTVITCDYRWSTTALYSDIVLPAAFHHEKEQFDSMVSSAVRFLAYSDRAIPPRHESKPELNILEGIVRAMEERADERDLETYEVPHGLTADEFNDLLNLEETLGTELDELPEELQEQFGTRRSYGDLYHRLYEQQFMQLMQEKESLDEEIGERTIEGEFGDRELTSMLRQIVGRCRDTGLVSEDTTLEEFKETGFMKYEGLGESVSGLNQAGRMEPDSTVTDFDLHTLEDKPFPTLTGRAQFYVDHPWFLEADEQLPRHKSPPAEHGGDRETYPFYVTSGHNRHSTHGCTLTNETQANMHRGEPHVFINETTARREGIEDGDRVRMFNDYDECVLQAKVSSQPAEDQLVLYHAWDHYLFEEGQGHHDLTPGLIKPIHLAGGYPQFEYHTMNWQPQQIDRHLCVDLEPVGDGSAGA